jgi:nucleoid-associated protein YgaU
MSNQPQDPDFSDMRGGAASSAAQEYTVAPGDSLSRIAQRFYGEGRLWPLIHAANANLIKNPDIIQAGWILTIPPRP